MTILKTWEVDDINDKWIGRFRQIFVAFLENYGFEIN